MPSCSQVSLPCGHSVHSTAYLPTLLLGDTTHPEFRGVVSLLRGTIAHQRLLEAVNVREGQALFPPGRELPELVVVCQTWSDQFSAAEVHTLLAWLPLARLICCYGPWCDSDGRTRDIWPLAVRVSASDAEPVVANALRELQGARPSEGGRSGGTQGSPLPGRLPLTASRNEVYEDRHVPPITTSLRGLRVAVSSADRAWRQMMERLVQGQQGTVIDGSTPARLPGVDQPQVLLWDADPICPERREDLARWRSAFPGLRVMAFVGFPRVDQVEELHRWGATRVCSKLSPLAELVAAVADLARRG